MDWKLVRDRVIHILLRISLICFLLVLLFSAFPNITYASSFGVGDTVQVTTNLNVRTGPGTGYSEITDPDYPGYAPAGIQGQVLEGPTSADGYIWWRVDFGPGLYSGWSVEDGLEKESVDVTLTLYVHEDSAGGPVISGANEQRNADLY